MLSGSVQDACSLWRAQLMRWLFFYAIDQYKGARSLSLHKSLASEIRLTYNFHHHWLRCTPCKALCAPMLQAMSASGRQTFHPLAVRYANAILAGLAQLWHCCHSGMCYCLLGGEACLGGNGCCQGQCCSSAFLWQLFQCSLSQQCHAHMLQASHLHKQVTLLQTGHGGIISNR